jgi:hypothetical protein
MSAVILRLVCAWCQTLMREGSVNAPTSHGMCPACREKFTAPG